MITFIVCIAALITGYFTYGKFVEKFFGASSSRPTPAKRLADGVDYQEMKPWRIFIIQFLNIAGLGPIFGAILGAAYGPVAHLDSPGLHLHGCRTRLLLRHAFGTQ